MFIYATITEALNDLKSRGYTHDFNLKQNVMYCEALNRYYDLTQLQLTETYRFEGDSDPADAAILYALISKDGVQGTFLNGYGVYANTDSDSFLQQLAK
jgi:hypothetical protein